MFTSKNIFIALTYNCNAFCKKCMTRYHKNKSIQMDMKTLNTIINLLNVNSYKGVISVGTGEPLLYSNIEYFISNILNINDSIKLRLLTNGMLLTPDLTDDYFNPRCVWGVTMDGFYNTTVQSVQKGVNIETVKNNVREVAKKHGGSAIYLNFTVYNHNVDEIIPFCEFAIRNNITDIYLTELKVFNGFETGLQEFSLVHDEHLMSVLQKAKTMLDYNNISTKGISIDKTYHRDNCFKQKLASPIIDVDGSVSFCSGREDVYIGNIMEENILSKWASVYNSLLKSSDAWCSLCFDKKLPNGSYRLPKTIIKET